MTTEKDLREFPVFSGLNDEELKLIIEVARERHYAAGSRIIEKNETGASMFLVCSGSVRVMLPVRDGDDVLLCMLGKGEFFGEMSLFDGKPRSAVVIADSDTEVIEIERGRFLEQIRSRPEMALRILAVMAERIRRSDERVSEIADRVYREAYPKIENALSSQLEAAKVIYEKTEDRAGRVLTDVERSWTTLTRVITIILGVASVVVGALAWFGYAEFNDAREAIAEDVQSIDTARKRAEELTKGIDQIAKATRDASIAREVVLEIGRIRREFDLDRAPGADKYEKIRQRSIEFERAEEKLYNHYLDSYEHWDPAIVLEAALTYTAFMKNTAFAPDERKVGSIVDAMLHVLDRLEPGDWRSRIEVSETLIALGSLDNGRWSDQVARPLKHRIDSGSANDHAERELAKVLFSIGVTGDKSREILFNTMYSADNAWVRFLAASQLFRANEPVAWEVILPPVTRRDEDGYIAAFVLAQLGPESLHEHGICDYAELVENRDPIRLVHERLRWQIENVFSRRADNPYRQQLTKMLAVDFRDRSCTGRGKVDL